MMSAIGPKPLGVVLLLATATAIAAPAQVFNVLLNFDGYYTGANSLAPLVQGTDGNLYGTAERGGSYDDGTVFRITPEGKTGTLHSFTNQADGGWPDGGLVLGPDGTLYGTTTRGGDSACNPATSGCGTVFIITPPANLTTLHSFTTADGHFPSSGLMLASDGNFYGTTYAGGASDYGTIFKITPTGKLTTLYSFCAQAGCTDGIYPTGGLVQGSDGNLYGTTEQGGDLPCGFSAGCGTVFKITRKGQLTRLHSFSEYTYREGARPHGGVVEANNGMFYGTTIAGGGFGYGSTFEISKAGELTTLYKFRNTNDGKQPFGGLIQATDGKLYGTTSTGAAQNVGTIFQMTRNGHLVTMHSFDGADGSFPYDTLLQSTNGIIYGTTYGGGPRLDGTVFSLDMGLAPFVSLLMNIGRVGQSEGILGQGFTGTTAVSFNGTPAAYVVLSDTFLQATVPAGASSGFVTVTTPSGTLRSNRKFRVKP